MSKAASFRCRAVGRQSRVARLLPNHLNAIPHQITAVRSNRRDVQTPMARRAVRTALSARRVLT
jgi:hypothetical protein